MSRLFKTTVLAAGLSASALLTGCSSTIESSDLRSNWTPELQSLTMSEDQYANSRSRVRHNNWRQVYDDWAALWLEDQNLKLTRYTLP